MEEGVNLMSLSKFAKQNCLHKSYLAVMHSFNSIHQLFVHKKVHFWVNQIILDLP